MGSDDGLIHLTKDGWASWENVTPKKMPDWMMINSIDASSFDSGTAYIAGTRYKLGDFTPYLYVTDDYGKNWKLITDGIKDEHFTRVLRSDKVNKNILYAGTETGMYISYDGNSWNEFQKNLPIVPITDLTINDNSLIVATQGRSIWMIDDLTVFHQLTPSTDQIKLYKPKDSYRMGGAGGRKSLTAGTNLPNGAIIHYFIPNYDKENDQVSLSIHSADGTLIKEFSDKSKEIY